MRLKSSQYKHVHRVKRLSSKDAKEWQAVVAKKGVKKWQKKFRNEREAAKAADIKLIELGYEPVNILKRVKQ